MSNYTVQTNFGAKDGLASGNAAKVIRGADFTVEFDNIATAIGTKLDSSGGSATNLTTTGTLTNSGAMTTTGTATFNGATTTAGTATFNGDVVVDTDTLFVDVSEDRVGINNASPATALDVTGVITTDNLTASSLETKTYGVDITGTNGSSVVAKVIAGDGQSANLKLKNTEGEFDIRCDGGTLDIYDVTDGASRLSFNTTGIATFGADKTVRSDVFSGTTATNSLLVLGNDSVTYGETSGTTLLANENLNLQAGPNDKIVLGEAGNHVDKMAVLDTANGNFGINTDSPTEKLDVNSDSIRLRTAKTPASATATGTQGQIAWDANYMYVCTATNTWKRVALATWS